MTVGEHHPHVPEGEQADKAEPGGDERHRNDEADDADAVQRRVLLPPAEEDADDGQRHAGQPGAAQIRPQHEQQAEPEQGTGESVGRGKAEA